MKVSKNFELEEFINKNTFLQYGSGSLKFIDNRIISIAQFLRDNFGGLTINDWHKGGHYNESGLRDFDTSTGAKFSQHKFGRAIDCKFSDYTVQQVYTKILANPKKFIDAGITTLEDISATPTWLHVDCRTTGKINDLTVVQP